MTGNLGTVKLNIEVNYTISLWNAIKLRIAGKVHKEIADRISQRIIDGIKKDD